MKILYVKNSSARAKAYQLQTIIYEENGQKFVKKEALCIEAIPHLMNMKESYSKLNSAIINPQVKLAKIVDESEKSLTFEYIDGVSLEEKFYEASSEGKESRDALVRSYIELLKSSFKTTTLTIDDNNSDDYQKLFGTESLSKFDKQESFEDISNIDLIFSNIIYQDETVYLIDYEWVFDMPMPIEYVVYRSIYHTLRDKSEIDAIDMVVDYSEVEKFFIDDVVMKDAFYYTKLNYYKRKHTIERVLEAKDEIIAKREEQIEERDQSILYWQGVAESMRLKNRVKQLLNKILPSKQD